MDVDSEKLFLIIGISFISLIFISLTCLCLFILKTNIEHSKIDKIIDVIKWAIASAALVVGSSIISDSFKERQVDQDQMTAFNTYLTYVTDSGDMVKKRELAEFFYAVSPEGEMKNAWLNYKKYLKSQNDTLSNLDLKENIITSQIKDKPTDILLSQLKVVQDEKEKLMQNLNIMESSSYLVIVSAYKSLEEAQLEVKRISLIGKHVIIYKKGNMFRIVLTGLKNKQAAEQTLNQISDEYSLQSYLVREKTWCSSPKNMQEYLECQ